MTIRLKIAGRPPLALRIEGRRGTVPGRAFYLTEAGRRVYVGQDLVRLHGASWTGEAPPPEWASLPELPEVPA